LDDFQIEPGFLDLRPGRRLADGLDGGDRSIADAADGKDAGPHRRAVHMHGAGAAKRHSAAELGAGHAEHVTQDPQQGDVGIDVDGVRGAVDFDSEGHWLAPTRAGYDRELSATSARPAMGT
jgi:hypothetical protein